MESDLWRKNVELKKGRCRYTLAHLLDAGAALPAAWAKARAVFLPTSNSIDIEIHRQVVPSAPFLAWVSRAILQQHALQPSRSTGGSQPGGSTGEWNMPTFLQRGLSPRRLLSGESKTRS